MAVSKRTRYEVLRRDNYTCRYCRSTEHPLTVDHVVPAALGGGDDPSNLVACCKDCNIGKASASPSDSMVADVAADMVRWCRAMQAAINIRSAARAERDGYVEHADEAWCRWHWGNDEIQKMPRPGNWEQSLWRFHEVGLPIEDLIDSIDKAASNNKVCVDETWRYMCGIAWRKLSEIQELARQQLEWTEQVGSADGA
jgi:hypothetical protein